MPSGRPPKPTALKRLEGTLRDDRQVANEMMPSTLEYAPSAPKTLSKEAKREWKSVCTELVLLGMLHRVDLGLVASYCNEMGTYWEADKIVKQQGLTITICTKFDSYDQVSPYVGIRNTSLKNAQALANQFGFTPAARSRISVIGKAKKSEFDEMIDSDDE